MFVERQIRRQVYSKNTDGIWSDDFSTTECQIMTADRIFPSVTLYLVPIHISSVLYMSSRSRLAVIHCWITRLKTTVPAVLPLDSEVRFQMQVTIKDLSDFSRDRSGCVISVLSTEVTEDPKDQRPNWMSRSVLGPKWRRKVTKDRSGCTPLFLNKPIQTTIQT